MPKFGQPGRKYGANLLYLLDDVPKVADGVRVENSFGEPCAPVVRSGDFPLENT